MYRRTPGHIGLQLHQCQVDEVDVITDSDTISDKQYGFLATGRDFQPADISHQYTQKERETLAKFESLDYLPSHSQVYKSWLKRQKRSRYEIQRWIMMGMIGFSVGFIGFIMHQLIEQIAQLKWEKAKEFLEKENFITVWAWAQGYTTIFVLVGAGSVVFFCKSAGGSGIPEVTGYLNGTLIPKIFGIKTMTVKFLSCVCAVGSGMPLGPEGPMIHLGASVGAALSQIKINLFAQLRNSEDKRNFVSAGAAAGVASAFGAPVGGLLFSMEEVSSFWTTTLSWQIFFCCMVSTFTTDLLNSSFSGFKYTGNFGYFKKERYILFSISHGINVNILMFIPTVVIGVIGGLLGAVFTIISLKLARMRSKVLSKFRVVSQKIICLLEPVVLMVIVTSVSVFSPALFRCTSYRCAHKEEGDAREGCYNNTDFTLHVESSLNNYTCPVGSTQPVNNTLLTNDSYNEVASLLFLTGEDALKHLFSRGTHLQFGYASLLSVLPYYLLMVCWASGTSVSSGILVPMLIIGALYGRVVGYSLVCILMGLQSNDAGYWNWMDPGAFALIGAASFFGGVTRLTKAVTVIMIELTNDVQFLLPFMVSIMVAKWVGDFFTHPHYHSILELKCIPFLRPEPQVVIDKKLVILDLYRAKNVMSSPVLTVCKRESVSILANILLNSTNSGFPVVSRADGKTFCGTITRLELCTLLMKEELFELEDENDLIDYYSTFIEYDKMTVDQLANARETNEILENYVTDPKYKDMYLDLEAYINQSAMCIPEKFSLQRTYIIFRSLGLRHLVVIDSKNHVKGIITRKDLMDFSIVEKISVVQANEMTRVNLEMNTPNSDDSI